MLRKDFWSKTASAFVVWRPYCWRKASRGVGAVYECPKKVRDLFVFQAIEAVVTTPMGAGWFVARLRARLAWGRSRRAAMVRRGPWPKRKVRKMGP